MLKIKSMDIRNFFGDKKAAVAKSSTPATIKDNNTKSCRRKSIIDDDGSADETESVSKLTSDIIFATTSEESSADIVPKGAPSSSAMTTIVHCSKVESVQSHTAVATAEVMESTSSCTKSKVTVSSTINADVSDTITWKAGESIPYLALVNTFEAISKVGGRLDKESLFCKLFRAIISTTPGELDAIVYLASNSVGPAYEGLELGIGDSLLVKAVCEATGRKKDAVEEDYEKEGDLGTVALLSRNSQKTLSFAMKPKPLLAVHVLEMLRAITRTKGERAQGRKVEIIKGIMVKCQGSEAKYIVRALQGKLRIGTAEQTVLVALAHSFALITPHAALIATVAEISEIAGDRKEVAMATERQDVEDVEGLTECKTAFLCFILFACSCNLNATFYSWNIRDYT